MNMQVFEIGGPDNKGMSGAKLQSLLTKLGELQSGKSKFTPVTPDEALGLLILAPWECKLGDIIKLRSQFNCTMPVISVDDEVVITRLISPPLMSPDPVSSDFVRILDIAVCLKSDHSTDEANPHFHYHELLADSRHFTRVGTVNDKIPQSAG